MRDIGQSEVTTGSSRGKYNGGKNGDGVYQRIINLIPPHRTWIEICAGSAAITRYIKPAEQSFLIEAEPLQAKKLRREMQARAVVINGSFYNEAERWPAASVDTFMFADPPYLKKVRTGARNIYKVEWDEHDHEVFLSWVDKREEMVMITHPICGLYGEALGHWNKVPYTYMSRQGKRDDCIWMNYAIQDRLHDYSYVGRDRIERQAIKRKIERELVKLSALQSIERNAIISAINEKFK